MTELPPDHPPPHPDRRTYLPLARAEEAEGTVVVIDVLRAFTTAAIALARGATAIELVGDVDQARARRREDPEVLLMGEVDGAPIPGFDLSNSPAEVAEADLAGRRLVQRTTAGTRGAVAAAHADLVLAGSFVVAAATAARLRAATNGPVTYLLTGIHGHLDGDEDRALADHLAALLEGRPPDIAASIERVRRSDAGRRFADPTQPQYRPEDLDIAVEVDRFDFAIAVERTDGRTVATAVPAEI